MSKERLFSFNFYMILKLQKKKKCVCKCFLRRIDFEIEEKCEFPLKILKIKFSLLYFTWLLSPTLGTGIHFFIMPVDSESDSNCLSVLVSSAHVCLCPKYRSQYSFWGILTDSIALYNTLLALCCYVNNCVNRRGVDYSMADCGSLHCYFLLLNIFLAKRGLTEFAFNTQLFCKDNIGWTFHSGPPFLHGINYFLLLTHYQLHRMLSLIWQASCFLFYAISGHNNFVIHYGYLSVHTSVCLSVKFVKTEKPKIDS